MAALEKRRSQNEQRRQSLQPSSLASFSGVMDETLEQEEEDILQAQESTTYTPEFVNLMVEFVRETGEHIKMNSKGDKKQTGSFIFQFFNEKYTKDFKKTVSFHFHFVFSQM